MIVEKKILKRECELSFDENRWTSFETCIEKSATSTHHSIDINTGKTLLWNFLFTHYFKLPRV